ncbi:MAG TPA: hypothetical protein VHY32_05865 [Caulobacteraceae bacterium]|nr:hypothetical protein [Caulobacteraceae bacterium]
MRFVSLFCVLALLGAAGSATAQPVSKPSSPPPPPPLGPELWRGARIGMSQNDVTALFPKATPSKGEILPTGARSGLTLPVTVGGAAANAQFYFDTSGLQTIIIDRPDVVAGKTDENLAKARRIIADVTAAWGAPASCIDRRRLAALNCTWKLEKTQTVVSYRDVAGFAPSLNIAFRKRDDLKIWAPGPVKKLKLR